LKSHKGGCRQNEQKGAKTHLGTRTARSGQPETQVVAHFQITWAWGNYPWEFRNKRRRAGPIKKRKGEKNADTKRGGSIRLA